MPLEVREADEPEQAAEEVDMTVAEMVIEGVPWSEMAKERRASLKAIFEFVNGFHPSLIFRRPADGSQSGELAQDDIPSCIVEAQREAFTTAWMVAGDLIAEMGRQLAPERDYS